MELTQATDRPDDGLPQRRDSRRLRRRRLEVQPDERARTVTQAIDAADRPDVAAVLQDHAVRARDAAVADPHFAALDRVSDDVAEVRALLVRRQKVRSADRWVVLVAFENGEFHYYKSVAEGLVDFTKTLSEASRYESDSAAWQLARRLNARNPGIKAIRVQRDTGS